MYRYRHDNPAPAQPYRQSGHPARVAAAHVHHHHHHRGQARHRLQPYRHPASQGRTEAVPRHHQPRREPHDGRPHRLKCNICSFSRAPVFHRHFSSLHLRELTGVESTGSAYLCPSCKSHHRPNPEPRTKIVVSDSQLHEFFAPPDHAMTSRM